MESTDGKRSAGRVAIPVGILGVGSTMVPVAVYAGVDLVRTRLG